MTDATLRHEAVAIEDPDLDGIDPAVYARRWKTLAVLCASLIIVIVGNTVLNVALPTLQMPTNAGGIGSARLNHTNGAGRRDASR